MHPFLNTAIQAARTAGTIITRGYSRLDLVKTSEKGPQDFVTNIDKKAEEAIIDALLSAYPSHSILSEERGSIKNDEEFQWIIDPLDGTTNFIHGLPHFSVSIALRQNDRLEHAVIYDPIRDDLFTTTRGEGAQRNNRRIRVSQKMHLSDCLLCTGFSSYALNQSGLHQKSFSHISEECFNIRQTGSAALDLAYLASGVIDGFWEPRLALWDIAAGVLLIKESGGLICDFDGRDDYLKNGSIIAGNAKILKNLLKHIQPLRSTQE